MDNHKDFIGTVIYEHNNPRQQVLLVRNTEKNNNQEFKIDEKMNISDGSKKQSLASILSDKNKKDLYETIKKEQNTSFMLSKDEIANLGESNLINNSYQIESGYEPNCPAELTMTDGKTGKEYTLGIWNGNPDDKDDLYICPFDKYQYQISESEDYRDTMQMDDVLTQTKYEEIKAAIFDQQQPFSISLNEHDFEINPKEILDDEKYGEEVKERESLLDLKSQYEMYQEHLKAENTGELTEEKVINRMDAENQYNNTKKDIIENNPAASKTIAKMEYNVKQSQKKKNNDLSM